MIAEKKYDYIFAGKGASAALVLIELEGRNLLNSKNILIVDPNQDSTNNKNFCFWTEDNGELKKKLKPFIEHNWSKIQLNNGKEEFLNPTSYNHIPNSIVIEKANEILEKHSAHVCRGFRVPKQVRVESRAFPGEAGHREVGSS